MKRSHVVAFVAALVACVMVGALVALLAGSDSPTSARTDPSPTTTSLPDADQRYLKALRDLGYLQMDADAELLLWQGKEHCKLLAAGSNRDDILKDSEALKGTPRRVKEEAVFDLAVAAFCPQRAPFIQKTT